MILQQTNTNNSVSEGMNQSIDHHFQGGNMLQKGSIGSQDMMFDSCYKGRKLPSKSRQVSINTNAMMTTDCGG
jgi:hypothetical protein